jgi:hypothetical protein
MGGDTSLPLSRDLEHPKFPSATTVEFNISHDPHKLNVQPPVPPAMTLLVSRVAHARCAVCHANTAPTRLRVAQIKHESFSSSCRVSALKVEKEKKVRSDPRINLLGRAIEDEFATIREKYGLLEAAQSDAS